MTPVRLALDLTKPMAMAEVPAQLRFGDALLYSSDGAVGRAIKLKTWSDVSHIEMWFGQGKVGASRDGQGVNTYDFTDRHLVYVLRPEQPLNAHAVLAYHESVIGQAYDFWGLMRFFTWGEQSTDKQFCSEWFTRASRRGGLDPFAKCYDADLVSPGMYHASPHYTHILAMRTDSLGVRWMYPVVDVER